MRRYRRFAHLIPLLILWLMLSAFLWGWVFTLITDTARENKLVLYVDAQTEGNTALAVEMERLLDGALRMVQVRPFAHAMMNGDALRQADLYIVPAPEAKEYADWYALLPARLREAVSVPAHETLPGLLIPDGSLPGRLLMPAEAVSPREPWYLFLGAGSLHLADNEGAADDLAVRAAVLLLEQ